MAQFNHKNSTSVNPELLFTTRHSAEHLLTFALQRLYGKDSFLMAMGPAIENGFYADIQLQDLTLSEEQFPAIEAEIARLIQEDLPFTRETVTSEQARELFANNPFKLELIQELEASKKEITIYRTGTFVDLCAGPHVETSSQVGVVKLLSLAGAYWHGDEHNPMLTRIYGTAFATQAELDAYLFQLEEAKRRDHKLLGQQLDLFTFSSLVGPGLPLWTPKGTLLRNLLDEFVWSLRGMQGYEKVEIPHITKKDLYVTSGHWEKYADDLFHITTREGHEFALKPMNCPHHTQIYARKLWSYRELPQRYANTTMCYRDEQTGELNGLSRVRAFTQDDAHVFCRMSQVKEEFLKIWDIVHEFYPAFGFELKVRLSRHDPDHWEKYLGNKDQWATAEALLREIISEKQVEAMDGVGEAAFYGPKLDFMALDALGREWQVATIQLDMNMPERFDLVCVNEQGEKEQVVMIHAAIMGSIERFLSILLEHTAGVLPSWLSPVQAVVIPISQDQTAYAQQTMSLLKNAGVRAELWNQAESMQNRIRKAEQEKIPFMVVVGKKEVADGTISVRRRGSRDTELMKAETLSTLIKEQAVAKTA